MKLSKLENLLQETNEAYYWIGFLLADGSISRKQIKLTLAKKDKFHIIKFLRFIENKKEPNPTNNNAFETTVSDWNIIPQIMDKFDIKARKTYNPPSKISISKPDLGLSLITGFIDGDGCIQNNRNNSTTLAIKCHSSWLNFLKGLSGIIYSFVKTTNIKKAKINNQNYSSFIITDPIVLKKLKIKVETLNIPILRRKWDNINIIKLGRKEKRKIRNRTIKILLKKDYNMREIADNLGLTPSTIREHIITYGLRDAI